jgi:hypothetical protein
MRKKSLKRKPDGSHCETWLQIPTDKYYDYDAGLKRCKIHDQIIYPHLVHNPKIDIDYTCFICGEDVCVRYLCRKCVYKK